MDANFMRIKFEEIFKRSDGQFFFAPGRVNLIGEHTDYNGGHVLPCALEMGTYALAASRDDGQVGLFSLNYPQENLSGGLKFKTIGLQPEAAFGWRLYPLGVFSALEKRGIDCPGADILFYGDLPSGAGLSSSASIEILTGLILNHFHGLNLSKTELALIGQEAENNFVGVNSGIMDQFAVAHCRRGHALLLNCETLASRQVPIDLSGAALWVVDSGKRRGLADSKYNQRRAECDLALESINKNSQRRFKAFGEMGAGEFEQYQFLIDDETQLRRARHAVSENLRALAAAQALEKGDLAAFGLLMNASHLSLRDDYEVSGPELDALAAAAAKQPQTLGVRMTGGGFGGCAIILAKLGDQAGYQKRINADYQAASGRQSAFYQIIPADGARILEKEIL